ncbi:MAG: hypothetical protein JSU68_01465 [Phycisphaerales bacterium]|nr:MAG: hypothetical protein JSU68_01465 [Phycisphaerales bacterium]
MASSIANATLGITLEFITLGRIESPKPPGRETQIIAREGVDGFAYKNLGVRGEVYRIRGQVDVVDAASRATWIKNARALKGRRCTYVDDFGTSWANQLVHNVTIPENRAIVNPVGGKQGTSGTIMLTIVFGLVDLRTSA